MADTQSALRSLAALGGASRPVPPPAPLPAPAADHRNRPLPSALVAVRDRLVRYLFHDGGLSCGTIARLRWEMFVEHGAVRAEVRSRSEHCEGFGRRIPDDLKPVLAALHREEREVGYGGASDYVVRFRGGSADLVSRANSVRRILDRTDRPAPPRPALP